MRLALILLLAAPAARAECTSIPQCLSQLKIPHADAVTLAKIGAVMAPAVLGVGAFFTAAMEKARPKEAPEGVVIVEDEAGQPRAALELVPAARDKYYNPNPPQERPKPSGAFRFNDTATNVALAVGGAAVITGIIAGIAKGKH
jgi:hypothetical protein